MSNADTIKAVTIRLKGLPPDPDGLNESRAESAGKAMAAFMKTANTDDESNLYDLLVNLRHWADRNGRDFDDVVERGRMSYDEETKRLADE